MPDTPNHNRNNDLAEALSALVDGETGGGEMPDGSADIDQLLDQVCRDERSKRAWQSYHLARDVVQKDYHSALPASFSASVSARLDSEETYSMVAQEASHGQRLQSSEQPAYAQTGDDNVVPFGARSKNPSSSEMSALTKSNRRWKSVAALGMAASVALATVAAVQLFDQSQSDAGAGTEIARLPPGSSTVEPLALTGGVVPAVLTGGGTHWRDSGRQGHALKVEQQLNSYLTNHLEDAAMGKVKGMISHSRVVGYDSSVLRSESF